MSIYFEILDVVYSTGNFKNQIMAKNCFYGGRQHARFIA